MTDRQPAITVTVPPAEGALDGAWRLLLALGNEPAMPRWLLIGGLMIELHAHEHGATPPRLTADADVLVDVRASPDGLPVVARWLTDNGLQLEAPDPFGVAHRFRGRDGAMVDLLAPDHVGPRANLATVPPARTIQAAAGTQLARRAEAVRVAYGGGQATILRPALIAAILGKYLAYRHNTGPSSRPADRHLTDVVFLLSLVGEPRNAGTGLTASERRHLRSLAEELQPDHRAWRALGDPADAQAALRLMVRSGRR